MSRGSLLLLFLGSFSALWGQQPLAQGDRDYTLSALHATRKFFLDTVAGLTPAQWTYKESPERWSVAEIAEHLALAESAIPKMSERAAQAPLDAEKKQKLSTRERDSALLKALPDRSSKFQAPEMLKPSGKFASPQAAVDAFRAGRDQNLKFIRETQTEMRGHFAPHPALGELDALQWYLLLAGHTERHVLQMKEVIAAQGFPKP